MRQFKPEQLNKRIKPSRFFETFVQQKGPNGVSRASVLEIQKNLRTFFLDLAFGNVVQEKYIQFMIGDPRVVQEAMTAAYNKIWECLVITQSMDAAISSNAPITQHPEFYTAYNKYKMRGTTYNVIYDGLCAFSNTQDPSYLTAISTKLNSGLMRGSKQQLML